MNILWYYQGADSKDEVFNIERIVDHNDFIMRCVMYWCQLIIWQVYHACKAAHAPCENICFGIVPLSSEDVITFVSEFGQL